MNKHLGQFLGRLLGRPDRDQPGRKNAGAVMAENDREGSISPTLEPGRRLYGIGDIHGRLDLLEELHEMIREDSAGFDGSKTVIYLGDYIDRGAQSSQVLDLLIAQPLEGFDTVYLMGNHEQSMLDFLQYPGAAAAWLTYGGQDTLLSYGVGQGRMVLTQDLEQIRDELEEKVPQSHLDFLRACRLFHIEGGYCFVHAGIRPDVPMQEQAAEDLLWIREDFIRSRTRHQHVVVHGHCITDEVEWQPNRIGIDTGAFQSGLLTALVLEEQDQRLLQTGRSGQQ